MASDITIRNRFIQEDADRQGVLDRARRCAAKSKPWVLPPSGFNQNTRLLDNFQSLVSRGITNLGGRIGSAAFPAELPFFDIEQSPKILNDPTVSDAQKQENEQLLFTRVMTIASLLESSDTPKPRHGAVGFRAAMRRAIEQLLITGDALLHFTDEYRLKSYRRDQYVTRRDATGDVICHIISESCDPLTLSGEQFSLSGYDANDLRSKHVTDRLRDLYTLIEYQPWSRMWVIRQEIDGKKVAESEETVPQYFSVPYELMGGEHYGRGFIEQNIGEICTFDEMSERMLDFAEMCTKMHPCSDYASEVREIDFEQPTGTPLRARVTNGEVQDVAFLKVDKTQDFGVAYKVWETLRNALGESMLMTSQSVRDSERTTAYEVQEAVIKELEGALGGFYVPMAEDLQHPLVRRAEYQAVRDKFLKPLPKGATSVQLLTGIAALARAARANRIRDFITDAAALDMMAAIDAGVLLNTMARYRLVREPGLIKTKERMQADVEHAVEMQAKQAAIQKTIDVVGNVAEAHAQPKQGAA